MTIILLFQIAIHLHLSWRDILGNNNRTEGIGQGRVQNKAVRRWEVKGDCKTKFSRWLYHNSQGACPI